MGEDEGKTTIQILLKQNSKIKDQIYKGGGTLLLQAAVAWEGPRPERRGVGDSATPFLVLGSTPSKSLMS
jgi:hypothetical protein